MISSRSIILCDWEIDDSSLYSVMIAQWENETVSLSVLSVVRVMITQWENDCISLSVLSVTRVMIAQWENECISISVLPVAQSHDSSVGK